MIKLQKTLAIFIAVMLVFILSVVTGFAATTYFSEDFESDTVGSYPSAFTVFNSSGEGNTYEVVSSGSNAFNIIAQNDSESSHYANFPAPSASETEITFGTSLRVQELGSEFDIYFGAPELDSRIRIDSNGGIFERGGGRIAPDGTILINTTYNIEMVMNLTTYTFDLLINGTLVGNDLTCYGGIDQFNNSPYIFLVVYAGTNETTNTLFDGMTVNGLSTQEIENPQTGQGSISWWIIALMAVVIAGAAAVIKTAMCNKI